MLYYVYSGPHVQLGAGPGGATAAISPASVAHRCSAALSATPTAAHCTSALRELNSIFPSLSPATTMPSILQLITTGQG